MQEFKPDAEYDLVALCWCLGYICNGEVVAFLKQCKAALRGDQMAVTGATEPKAYIIVIDNVPDAAIHSQDKQGEQRLRNPEKFEQLFEEAGLKIHGEPMDAELGEHALNIRAWKLY